MPDEEDGEDDGDGEGSGTSIYRHAPEFDPTLSWCVTTRHDRRLRAYFSDDETARRFAEGLSNRTIPVTVAADRAFELGGVALVFLYWMRGGFQLWLNVQDGSILLYRGKKWLPPSHGSVPLARAAALAVLARATAVEDPAAPNSIGEVTAEPPPP